jgi:hypothetical protein
MPSKSMNAKIFRVKIEKGRAGLYYATSPNLKGLLVAGDTMEKAEMAVPQAIKDLYAACDMEVVVTRADDGNEGLAPYVAIPSQIAREQLAIVS